MSIFAISAILYIFGTFGNVYRPVISQIPVFKKFFSSYIQIFVTTRNGVFFGFFFLVLGYFIHERADQLRKRSYGIYACFGILVLIMEDTIISRSFPRHSHDLYLSLPFAATALFLFVCFLPVKESHAARGKWLRNMSTLIFVLHMFVNFYANKLLRGWLDVTYGSGVKYLIAVTGSIAIGQIILSMSRKSSILRKFY